jgi:hypothetical protein
MAQICLVSAPVIERRRSSQAASSTSRPRASKSTTRATQLPTDEPVFVLEQDDLPPDDNDMDNYFDFTMGDPDEAHDTMPSAR